LTEIRAFLRKSRSLQTAKQELLRMPEWLEKNSPMAGERIPEMREDVRPQM
jgi:hypothetical protein